MALAKIAAARGRGEPVRAWLEWKRFDMVLPHSRDEYECADRRGTAVVAQQAQPAVDPRLLGEMTTRRPVETSALVGGEQKEKRRREPLAWRQLLFEMLQ